MHVAIVLRALSFACSTSRRFESVLIEISFATSSASGNAFASPHASTAAGAVHAHTASTYALQASWPRLSSGAGSGGAVSRSGGGPSAAFFLQPAAATRHASTTAARVIALSSLDAREHYGDVVDAALLVGGLDQLLDCAIEIALAH